MIILQQDDDSNSSSIVDEDGQPVPKELLRVHKMGQKGIISLYFFLIFLFLFCPPFINFLATRRSSDIFRGSLPSRPSNRDFKKPLYLFITSF